MGVKKKKKKKGELLAISGSSMSGYNNKKIQYSCKNLNLKKKWT